MIEITDQLTISEHELELTAIRSQGPGGQNVNKVATAILLKFDITKSSLPEHIKQQLMTYSDRRITSNGMILIKAQRYRSQDQNKTDAIMRFIVLIKHAIEIKKPRKRTGIPNSSKRKRVDEKKHRGQIKLHRKKPDVDT